MNIKDKIDQMEKSAQLNKFIDNVTTEVNKFYEKSNTELFNEQKPACRNRQKLCQGYKGKIALCTVFKLSMKII